MGTNDTGGDGRSLDGWSALITGGGSGIGLACAQRLAADGASVTICGRSVDRLREAVSSIEEVAAPGAQVAAQQADVTDEASIAAAVAAASGLIGRLDAIVISAGGSETIGPVTQTDAEAWRRTIDLNVTGAMLTIKHGARVMAAQGGGAIVAMSSVASPRTHRWFGAYGPSKRALEALCETAADELGASGIRVNTVRPGLTRTELVEVITSPGPVLDDYLSCMPLGRVGEVDEVAALVRFLVGPEATWVTGQSIGIDGGHSLRRGPDMSSVLEDLFGAEGLRGVVSDG